MMNECYEVTATPFLSRIVATVSIKLKRELTVNMHLSSIEGVFLISCPSEFRGTFFVDHCSGWFRIQPQTTWPMLIIITANFFRE